MHSLAATMTGSGRDVLLLHGLPCPSSHLEPLARALTDAGHRAILVDLPGYGASPPLPGEYSMRRAREALEDMLIDHGVRELDVVGFSAGAYRAIDLALGGRVRVGRIVTLGGMAGLDPEIADAHLELAAAIEAGAELGEVLARRMLSPTYAAAHPEALVDVAAWLQAAPATVIAAEIRAMARAEDLRERLDAVEAFLVARVGELDMATPPAWSEEIVRRAPRAALQVVPGKGHALLIEDEAATIEAVREALETASRDGETLAATAIRAPHLPLSASAQAG